MKTDFADFLTDFAKSLKKQRKVLKKRYQWECVDDKVQEHIELAEKNAPAGIIYVLPMWIFSRWSQKLPELCADLKI